MGAFPAFTIPESHAELTDERPIVKVLIDVSEPVSLLTSSLVELGSTTGSLIDDNTAQYIANSLLAGAISPHARNEGARQFAAFFHSEVHGQVTQILDNVKDMIGVDIVHAERTTEKMIGQSIYPCNDMSGIGFRSGNVAVLRYRVGTDPMDDIVDDPYAGMDIHERRFNEQADEDLDNELDDQEQGNELL